jgi:hypothetical protein
MQESPQTCFRGSIRRLFVPFCTFPKKGTFCIDVCSKPVWVGKLQLSSPNLTAEVGYKRTSRLHCLEVFDVALNMADSMDNPSCCQVGLPMGKAWVRTTSQLRLFIWLILWIIPLVASWVANGKGLGTNNFTTEVVHMADSMDNPSCCQVGLPLGKAWVQRPTSQLRLFIPLTYG